MKNFYCFIFLIAVITTSCQKHLSREDARKMIVENNKYPQKYNYNISKGYIKDMNTEGRGATIVLGEDDTKREEKLIEQFQSIGLLKLEKTPHQEESTAFLFGTTVRTWTAVKVTLTETGRKYLVGENNGNYIVNLWEINVKDITGIQETPEQKSAKVDYSISNQNITPFGSIFNDKNDVRQLSAYFSLYDDGWRIQ